MAYMKDDEKAAARAKLEQVAEVLKRLDHPAWRYESTEHWHLGDLVNDEVGVKVFVCDRGGKVEFSATTVATVNVDQPSLWSAVKVEPREIGASIAKSPEQIATDLCRRLLPGAYDAAREAANNYRLSIAEWKAWHVLNEQHKDVIGPFVVRRPSKVEKNHFDPSSTEHISSQEWDVSATDDPEFETWWNGVHGKVKVRCCYDAGRQGISGYKYEVDLENLTLEQVGAILAAMRS